MGLKEKPANFLAGETFGEEIAQSEKIAKGFAHFLAFDEQKGAVQPIPGERLAVRLASCPFTLSNFILVMRKNQIFAAHVNIDTWAEEFHTHGAALDVPARTAFAPRAGPEHATIIGSAGLPKGEVGDSFLGVFVVGDALTLAHFLKIQFEQLAVGVAGGAIFFDAEIDRAIGGSIGDALLHQLVNQIDYFRDVFGGAGSFVRTQAAEGLEIFKEGGFVFLDEVAEVCFIFGDAADDFVFDVGDVHDVADIVTLELERATDEVGEDESAEIADVGEVVDGGAAAIEADVFAGGIQRGANSTSDRESVLKNFSDIKPPYCMIFRMVSSCCSMAFLTTRARPRAVS